ncbi:hypothetical protein PUN28_015046 [Cardiocondyla obscurior]|uniref:Uncharacterized protein n=1 Tax=Cardiocondyla obscurior TaxID=286306 RepID=A0AAW2F2S2_9HYME
MQSGTIGNEDMVRRGYEERFRFADGWATGFCTACIGHIAYTAYCKWVAASAAPWDSSGPRRSLLSS